MKLRHKIILLCVALVSICCLSLAVTISLLLPNLEQQINVEVEGLADIESENITRTLRLLYDASNIATLEKLEEDLLLFRKTINNSGGFTLAQAKISWDAVNQNTGESKKVFLPQVFLGKAISENANSLSDLIRIVDDITKYTGSYCTVFQRMNAEGDMLRIATTVVNSDKSRAIGTFLPYGSPAVKTVLSGKTFRGRAYVVNQWHMAAYEPIYDQNNYIIGMLYVGVGLGGISKNLIKTVESVRVGKTGYAYILSANGPDLGKLLAHPEKELIGTNIIDSKDPSGRFFIKELIEKAIADDGKVGFFRYSWQNPGESHPREKVVGYSYFQPWDLVIAAGMYYDDFYDIERFVNVAMGRVVKVTISVCLIVFIVGLLLSLQITKTIVASLNRVVAFAGQMGAGDLSVRVDLKNGHAKDELAEMAIALNSMADDLQFKNDELTRYTYTVSHDLKSPLVTIASFVGYLEEDIGGNDPQLIKRDISYIKNAAEKMQQLLDELLHLSRVGNQNITLEWLDYRKVVDQALALVAGRILNKNAIIKLGKMDVVIKADQRRIVEVFQNLIDNAIKFSGDESEIEIGAHETSSNFELYVRDNGIGIDSRYQQRIFGLFEKLDSLQEGTGVGLALVKRIIEIHGGRVRVESEVGVGTTFYITLPEIKKRDRPFPEDL